ncbi:MAG TPA: T9SS type A sorting domain-containing protein [Saprospiraceae bacterium]|nr:T9SS type A sorting domain-containing protein [Saprospiraceae bacterium]HQW56809.1 T9SS type A sorting domain-containing protein [Saprospiraceae bacterium]
MHRTVLILLFYIGYTQLVSAQTGIPTVGSVYYYQSVKSPKIAVVPSKGKVAFWDYAFLESAFALNYKVSRANSKNKLVPSKANLAISDNFGNTSFYTTDKNSLNYWGFTGKDPFELGSLASISFTKGLPEIYNNLKQGTSLNYLTLGEIVYDIRTLKEVTLRAFPFLPDSFRIKVEIARNIKVDGQGKLYLPGQTFDKTNRITETENYNYIYEIKSGTSDWIDVSSYMSNVLFPPISRKRILFIAPKNVLPVLTLNISEELNTIESATFLITKRAASLKSGMNGSPQIGVYPNPAFTDDIRIEFNNIPTGRYVLKIYSLIGNLEMQKEYYINNYKYDSLDIRSLNPGVYIYALQNSSGKVLFSKRLTVVSP